MDRKIIMGVAAVAGIGLLLYLRKSGDSSAIGASGSMLGAAAAANNWASQPYVITTNTKAPAVVDSSAKSPAPDPAPAPAPSSGAVWGGSSPSAQAVDRSKEYLDDKGYWHYADGSSAYTGGGTFGHVNNGKTDGQNAMAMLGY